MIHKWNNCEQEPKTSNILKPHLKYKKKIKSRILWNPAMHSIPFSDANELYSSFAIVGERLNFFWIYAWNLLSPYIESTLNGTGNEFDNP